MRRGEIAVEALFEPMQTCGDALLGIGDWRAGQALPGLQELEACCADEPVTERGDLFLDLVLGFGDQLGRSGRGGGAQVGGKVGDGEVGFVADGRDYGQFRSWRWPARRAPS